MKLLLKGWDGYELDHTLPRPITSNGDASHHSRRESGLRYKLPTEYGQVVLRTVRALLSETEVMRYSLFFFFAAIGNHEQHAMFEETTVNRQSGLVTCPRCGSSLPSKRMAKHTGSRQCLRWSKLERKWPTRTKSSVWTVGGGLPDSSRSRH